MARIASFLNQYAIAGTRSSYRGGVYAFLTSLYGFARKGKRITDDEKLKFETYAERYFLETHDHSQDLIQFANFCSKKYAPTTGNYYHTAVKEFFIFNDVELSRKQERNLKNKIKRGNPISKEETLDREMIRKLLNNCDLKVKTLILFIISSGVRISEVLDLDLSDVKISKDNSHGVVTIRESKNNHPRITFINREAVEVLNQWIDQREEYLKYIIKKSKGRFRVKTPSKDSRLFPVTKNSAEKNIKTALKKADLFEVDRDTGRATIHYHLFRKFFVTQLSYSGIPDKYIEFFVGHLDVLDRTYNKPSIEKLLEVYLKGEPYLRIYDEGFEEIAKNQEEIKATQEKVRDMQLEHLMQKSKMDDMMKEHEKMQQQIAQLTRAAKIAEELPD